jgi:TyrR family helix-turn-helix protein
VQFIITVTYNMVNVQQYYDENEQFFKHIKPIDPFSVPVSQRTEQMTALDFKISSISDTDVTVLITGESGTGKTVMANYIHSISLRKHKPFVHINCSSLPEALMESELFGYVSGSFSGAKPGGKIGLIEAADKGTVFLDEIGDMPLAMQAKLLVFLQENYFYKIGGTTRTTVDVRVIAATNANLPEKIQHKLFREDLFYRLNVMPIDIPPLRKRKREILSLSSAFLQQYNTKYNKNRYFAFAAQYPLLMYTWPGNIRELQHHIERLVITAKEDQITGEMINSDIRSNCDRTYIPDSANPLPTGSPAHYTAKNAINDFERDMLLSCIDQFSSGRQFAKALGISHTGLANKLRLYDIRPPWKK